MKYEKLRFGDIMQSSILFYDKEIEAACVDICNYLKIDKLPSISGKVYYEKTSSGFVERDIEPGSVVLINDSIFSENALIKFEENLHNVLFVFEENNFVGVVHVSDYNRDIVIQNIQDDILNFERKLRQFLIFKGLQNADMLNFYKLKYEKKKEEFWKGKVNNYLKKEKEIDSFGPFQLFDFSDLLNLIQSKSSNSGYLFRNTENLRILRNMAMHGKDPISKNMETSIYSIQTLRSLYDKLDNLKFEYFKILNLNRNNSDYLKSIELENRSKLEIIHNHHPRALEYFLGL